MATVAGRNRCITCGKDKATLRCGGCLREFCFNHLADHRQELSKQLDEIEVSRDLFRQTLNEQTTDQQKFALMQEIDDWERNSIEEIQRTAEEARDKLLKHVTEEIEKIEINLNILTKQLQQSREENDFYETDLNHWNEELARLKKELSRPLSVNLRQTSTPLIYKLYVDTTSVPSKQQINVEKKTAISTPLKKLSLKVDPDRSVQREINILLLGETGVGKSTFINALANYLTFDTLEQARSGQPIVLMPVSFLITEGDDFKERILTFGDKDPNEDHNQSGQSVTQQCRSYIFTIDNQTKIRLIDTPGMGDTRGLDQDDLNMQHILSFINNLSHLNALCILLKPNEARLNVVLRSYFTRLVGFLGEHVCDNVIFCFTSTRTMFFAPGNTGPLLRKMLQSQSIKDIPFGKNNKFCFDNESFRYLIALLQGIKFDDYQKEEYKQSWITSVKELNRLLEYICTELKPYPQNKWQSIEHAQFQITLLIRPMLETLRNLFRNVILQKHQSSQLPIELFPTPLSEPSTICLKCQFTIQCCSEFLVVPDKLHIVSDKCKNCSCSRRHHINVEYKLDYRNADITNRESWEKVKSDLDQLKRMILELTYFFTSIVPHSENNDPITKVLTQMIAEENRICSSEDTKYFNPKLSSRLHQFNEEYKQKRNDSISNGNSIDLLTVYQLIEKISGMDSIKKQIDVVKQFRQEYMKNQEVEIHNDVRLKRN